MSLLLRNLTRSVLRNNSKQFIYSRFLATAATTAYPEIDKLVKNNKVVVFMKGSPEEPRCGFSKAVVTIMGMHDVPYDSHDVLANDKLRQDIKDYSNWPTIPQVYIDGEFVGGCDIMIQMHQNGELIQELNKVGIKSALEESTEKNT